MNDLTLWFLLALWLVILISTLHAQLETTDMLVYELLNDEPIGRSIVLCITLIMVKMVAIYGLLWTLTRWFQ